LEFNEILHKKVSPPFEGEVAGPFFNYDTNADIGWGG
jgi:hypothetical protein